MTSIDSAINSLLAAQQGALKLAISTAVASKQLDAQEQQGQAVANLLENAVQISKEAGKGQHFDTRV